VEALPKALVAQGHEAAVVLPRYRGTKATAVGDAELDDSDGRDAGCVFRRCGWHGFEWGALFLVEDPAVFRPRRFIWREHRRLIRTTRSAMRSSAGRR